jgi:hypothetical protein
VGKWYTFIELGMAKSTISTILKNKAAITAAYVATGLKTVTSKSSSAVEEVEEQLMVWINEKQKIKDSSFDFSEND